MEEKNELLASAKLTSKGQITIPKIVRETLNIEEGDSVIFYLDEKKNIKISKYSGDMEIKYMKEGANEQ